MAQTTTTMKKTAYAALGLPSQLVKKLRDGVSSVAENTDDARERLMLQVQEAVDEWKREGERVTTSIADKVKGRTQQAKDTAGERIAIAEDVSRGVAATISTPAVPVEQIDGVGPIYADQLATAGVVTTRGLLERCDSQDAIQRLADQTGIGAGLIEGWVADADLTRIGGIGSDHMSLLNAISIGAISHLAEQSAEDLRRMATELDDETLGPIPSEDTFSRWISLAQQI